jgi:hypothetical protein
MITFPLQIVNKHTYVGSIALTTATSLGPRSPSSNNKAQIQDLGTLTHPPLSQGEKKIHIPRLSGAG